MDMTKRSNRGFLANLKRVLEQQASDRQVRGQAGSCPRAYLIADVPKVGRLPPRRGVLPSGVDYGTPVCLSQFVAESVPSSP
jgi:hypothetical protein